MDNIPNAFIIMEDSIAHLSDNMTDDKTQTQLNHYSWNVLLKFISKNPANIKLINFKETKCIN